MRDTELVFDDAMIAHDPGPRHPERPDRLRAIYDRLQSSDLQGVKWVEPDPVEREALESVHDADYIDTIDGLAGESARLDPDTHVSPKSVDAAHLAAGGAIRATRDVCRGDVDRAFALVRPPGHHAEADRAMGFCLVNNIAIAAEDALATVDDVDRVLVLDWDVHHGNGTQHAFESRDDVLYVSVHRHPFFPNTGPADRVGEAKGEGYNVNIPLSGGASDSDYFAVFDRILAPIVDEYAPDLLLISAGFDAHQRDPLGGMQVSTDGFEQLCARVDRWAERLADGRLALVLEGGYDLDGLADSVEYCTRVLAGGEVAEREYETGEAIEATIEDVTRIQSGYWSC